MAVYGNEPRYRLAEDVSFNGASLRELDSRIISVRLIEESAEDTTQWGQRALLDGQILLSAKRVKKTLAVEFALNEIYDYAEKVQLLDKINAWATSAKAGYLQASTQTAPPIQAQPGLPDIPKEIMVRCSKTAVPGDAWAYDAKYRIEFETLGTPYWTDSQDQTIMPASGTQSTFTVGGRGNAPAPVGFSASAPSGAMGYVMARLNLDTTPGLKYSNYFNGTVEDGTLNGNDGSDLPDPGGNRVRTVGYTELPGGVYYIHARVRSISITAQYWIAVYHVGTHEYIASESSADWSNDTAFFAVRDNREIRIVWRGVGGSLSASDIAEVRVEDQTEHSESAMVFVGEYQGLSVGWSYQNGIGVFNGYNSDGEVNPLAGLTENSAEALMVPPGNASTLTVNSDISTMMAASFRGWWL